jgi:multidrug resistance efflux pump
MSAPAVAAEGKPYPLGAAVSAVVSQVLVASGAHVTAGQPLVKLDCRPREAEIQMRTAELAAAEAAFQRTKNGARPDEIAIGEARVGLAQARAEEAADANARGKALTEGVTITRAQLLEQRREARMTAAQLNDAQKQLALLRAGSRQEDIDEYQALRDAAAGRLAEAKAKLDQCTVVAPAAGVVEILATPGQFFSKYAPAPVATLTPDGK